MSGNVMKIAGSSQGPVFYADIERGDDGAQQDNSGEKVPGESLVCESATRLLFQGAPHWKNMFRSPGWMIALEELFEVITVPVPAFA